jgi:hypothetical protein
VNVFIRLVEDKKQDNLTPLENKKRGPVKLKSTKNLDEMKSAKVGNHFCRIIPS